MQFRAEKSVILSAIKTVSKYAAKNDSIPVLAHLRIVAKAGSISIEATDLDRAASTNFLADISREGEILLPSAALLRILSDAQGAEVSVEAEEAGAKIKLGRSNFRLPSLPLMQFPDSAIMTREATNTFEVDGAILRRIATEVAVSAWLEKDRDYLKGVFWHADRADLHFVSTNGVILSHFSTELPGGAEAMPGVIVPIFALPDWDGAVKVEMTPEFIRLSCQGVTVASKLIEGSFPDYMRILPKSPGASVVVDAEEFESALRRVSHFGDRSKKSVRLTVTDGEMWLKASSALGDAEEVIRCDGDDATQLVGSLDVLPLLSGWAPQKARLTFRDTASMVIMDDPENAQKFTFFVPVPDFGMRAAA
jgi:DNA polymerase-3 subunit beta